MTTRFPSPPPTYHNQGAALEQHPHDPLDSQRIPLSTSSSPTPPNRHALTPYLTLPHLLSLTWLAYPILSLLFIAFRLIESTGSAQDAVADAKSTLMTSCVAAQSAATAASSMPRYMAMGTNDQIIDAVNASMNAARATMIFSLTIVEAIIEFAIDIYRSTFLCFLELVVRGGLAILIGAVQEISDFITSTLSTIRTSIQNDVATANKVIAAAVSAINKVTSLVNVNLNVPQFDIPSLNALSNVTIPDDFENALLKLNSSLPTLDELRDKLDAIIEKPFDAVKADINNTFAGINFNSTVFDLPPQRTLSFCSNMDTSVVDDLGRDIVKIARIAAGILVVAAVLLVLSNCVVQWWQWRSLQTHLEYIREAWRADPTVVHVNPQQPGAPPQLDMSDHNLMMLINTAEHPLLSRIADNVTRVFRLTPTQHINMRFFASYVFYAPALVCLLIGTFGIISVELQLAAIGPIQRHYSQQVSNSVNDFSVQIASGINSGMSEQSSAYASQVNTHILAVQTTINDGMFGWVNSTTTTLNNTLVAFYSDIQDAVNATFGGTILESPAREFIRCIIGTKIEGMETALTFLHDHLKVDMPVVSNDVLMLSNGTVEEVTKPIALAAVGGSDSNNDGSQEEGLVGKLVNRYVAALKKERLMFGIFLAIWAFVALCAICIILWHSYGADAVDAYKRKRFMKENQGAITPWFHREGLSSDSDRASLRPANLAAPKHHSTSLAADAALASEWERRYDGKAYGEEQKTPVVESNLRSFTPLASPKQSRFVAPFGSGDRYPTLLPPPHHPLADVSSRLDSGWDADADVEKNAGKKSIWARGAKLRNNARAATKRDPFGFTPAVVHHDLPASNDNADDSSGWLSKTLAGLAFWRAAPSSETDEHASSPRDPNRQTLIIPSITRSSATPPQSFTLSAPPPPRAQQPRSRDFPQSVQMDGEFGFGSASTAAPIANVDAPELPIHYHFVSSQQEEGDDQNRHQRPPRASNPFSDEQRLRSKPRLSSFPPPGLLASRTLTPAYAQQQPQYQHEELQRPRDPFVTPFDDPSTPPYSQHQLPPTPAFSMSSGRYPRAI